MTGKDLKNSILQFAIQGKLVPQDPNDEPASVLLAKIRKEKEKLVREKKLKKKDLETTPVTDEEKPFEIPESWEWCRCKSVFLPTTNKIPCGEYFMYIDTDAVNNKTHIVTPKKTNTKDASSRARRVLKIDDIIYSKVRPYLQNVAIIDTEELANCIGSTGFYIMRSSGELKPRFLFYLTLSQYFTSGINSFMKGEKSPSVNDVNIEEFLIPLPPLAEQKRIVEKIEELMPLVEEYDKAQEKLDKLNSTFPEALKTSILQEAIQGKLVPQDPNDEPASILLTKIRKEKEKLVKEKKLKKKDLETKPIADDEKPFEIPESWEWVKMMDIALVARGGSPRPIKDYITESPKGVNWIKIGDAEKGGKYINSCKEKIKPEGVKRSRIVYPGDFLLTNSMSYGRPYITNIQGCIHDGWLVISQYCQVYNPNFLYFLLSSPFAYSQFSDKTAGAVVQNLNKDKVSESIFPLPPLAEQKRIVEKIEEVLAEIEKLKSELK